jgi:hypothetical protein
VNGFFTRFIATYANILTSDTSTAPYGTASQAYGTLSYRVVNYTRSFGDVLSPVISSAQTDSTSELLRFL